MFKIKSIVINNIWKEYSLNIPLDSDINLFIGKNGTGKSTLLNILTAILKVDLQTIGYYDFSDIKIIFISNKKQKTLEVLKSIGRHSKINLIYKLSSKIIGKIAFYDRDNDFYYRSSRTEEVKNITNIIEEFVQINDLSTARLSKNDDLETLYEKYPRKAIDKMELMDKKIEILIDGLQKYRFGLERDLVNISKKFQQDVLETLMKKHESISKININDKLDLKKMQEGIEEAYIEFGISEKNAKKKALTYMNENNLSHNSILKEDEITPALISMSHILENLRILKTKKYNIMSPLKKLVELLKIFIDDKQFYFDTHENIQIIKNSKTLKISDLSSGEKQLLILFLQTLLQNGENIIFIADEPELSLHIVWQRHLVKAIKTLNPNSQILFATHSTEICGDFREFTKKLEDYVC